MPVLASLKTLFCTGIFIDPCINNNVPLRRLAAQGGSPGFQAGDKVEMTLGFQPRRLEIRRFVMQVSNNCQAMARHESIFPNEYAGYTLLSGAFGLLSNEGRAYLNHGRPGGVS